MEKCGRARRATDFSMAHTQACWVAKARNTLKMCSIRCVPTARLVTRTKLFVTLYVHCLSCLNYTAVFTPYFVLLNQAQCLCMYGLMWRRIHPSARPVLFSSSLILLIVSSFTLQHGGELSIVYCFSLRSLFAIV